MTRRALARARRRAPVVRRLVAHPAAAGAVHHRRRAAVPSPSPSPSPAANSCPWGPFAPGPVTRLAISPRALECDGARAPMRTRLVGPGEELLCLDSEKSHRIDFNLNQRNEFGQESLLGGPAALPHPRRHGPHRLRPGGPSTTTGSSCASASSRAGSTRPPSAWRRSWTASSPPVDVGRRLPDRAPARHHAARRRDRPPVQVRLDRQRRLRARLLPRGEPGRYFEMPSPFTGLVRVPSPS